MQHSEFGDFIDTNDPGVYEPQQQQPVQTNVYRQPTTNVYRQEATEAISIWERHFLLTFVVAMCVLFLYVCFYMYQMYTYKLDANHVEFIHVVKQAARKADSLPHGHSIRREEEDYVDE